MSDAIARQRTMNRAAPALVAPVVPTAAASSRLRPIGLGGVRIDGGLWADRRRTNHDVTIPHGAAQLEAAGNLDNFRMAAGAAPGRYRGGADDSGTPFPFLDSDVYKWLEAVGWELAQRPDPALAELADPVIGLVASAQRADGYLNSYFQVAAPGREFTDLQWGHELYTAGHLLQAAVAWHRALGDDRLLGVAQRVVGRIEDELGPGRRELVCGHPEIEMALVELYRTTGEARHVELARTLVERRGHGLLGKGRYGSAYWQDHAPVRSAPVPVGHAVRQVYLDCGAVDVAVETGDRELLDGVIRRWEAMVGARTYLTGALGARHRDEAFGDAFELPPDRAYAETCAAIGSVMLAWRLLLATGEPRFADLIERTALNAVLGGIALDGRRFFYSNPLQRRSGGLVVLEGAGATQRSPWFPCACCPPNLMRFLATMPDLVATADDHGIQLHQYATASIEAPLGPGRVALETRTGYPWDGTIDVVVTATTAAPWSLRLRVPAWSESARLELNGEPVPVETGHAAIDRAWSAGDRVRLRLDMAPRVTVPDPRIDALRGTVALERGPIVYALEEADVPSGVSLESLAIAGRPEAAPLDAEAGPLAGMVGLHVTASAEHPRRAGWPYRTARRGHAAEQAGGGNSPDAIPLRMIPFFAWGNRRGTGMRVWVPSPGEDAAGSAAARARSPGGVDEGGEDRRP